MSHGKNWITLSGMLLATCMLTSCEMPRVISSYMGEERTLPEGAEASFGTPRRPILNPIGNGSYQNMSNISSPTVEQPRRMNIAAAEQSNSVVRGRHIPRENIAMLSGNMPATIQMASTVKAAPTIAVDTALNDALTTPSYSAPALTPPSASVAAVDTAIQQPMIAQAEPAPQQKPDIFAVADLPEPKAEQQVAATEEPTALMEPATVAAVEPAIPEAAQQQQAALEPATTAQTEQAVVATATEQSPSFFERLGRAVTAVMDPKPSTEQQVAADETQTLAASEPAAGSNEAPQQEIVVLTPPSAPKPEEIASTATIEQAALTTVSTSATKEEQTAKEDESPTKDTYPTLASVPDAPVRTPASDIAFDMKSLADNRDTSQNAGNALMNNPNAAVMTSPQTGQVVANASDAMPNLAPSAGGNDDLTVPPSAEARPADIIDKAMQAQALKEQQPVADPAAAEQPAEAPVAATVPAAQPVAEPAVAQPTDAKPTSTPLSQIEPSAGTPEETAPVVANTQADATPAPLMAAAPADDVVRLRAPVSVPEYTPVSGTTGEAPAQPSVETATAAEITKAVKYLPESRYAKRRLAPINESY